MHPAKKSWHACCVSSVAQSRAKQLKPWGIKTCKMIWLLLFLFFFDCALTICIDPSLNSLEQDNPDLVKYVQDKLLEGPPIFPNTIEEMDLSTRDSVLPDFGSLQGQFGQAPFLEELFKPLVESKNFTRRFFIEAGSFDGIVGSNTLRLELDPMWSGLLVEPNPELYKLTKSRSRNVWTSPSCFSTKTRSEIVDFDAAGQIGGIINKDSRKLPGDGYGYEDRKMISLQCFPLYTILLALGKFKE